MGIHLVFFLHITTGPESTNNVLALAFGVLIVALVIIGSILIMANLNANMMSGRTDEFAHAALNAGTGACRHRCSLRLQYGAVGEVQGTSPSGRPSQDEAVVQRDYTNGTHGSSSVATPVRFHHLVPYHLPILHDWAGGMAHRTRGAIPRYGKTGLSCWCSNSGSRYSAWHSDWRRFRDRDGIPVRYQLERTLQDVRTDPGTTSVVRKLHRFHAGSKLSSGSSFRPRARSSDGSTCFQRRWSRSGQRSRLFGS